MEDMVCMCPQGEVINTDKVPIAAGVDAFMSVSEGSECCMVPDCV